MKFKFFVGMVLVLASVGLKAQAKPGFLQGIRNYLAQQSSNARARSGMRKFLKENGIDYNKMARIRKVGNNPRTEQGSILAKIMPKSKSPGDDLVDAILTAPIPRK